MQRQQKGRKMRLATWIAGIVVLTLLVGATLLLLNQWIFDMPVALPGK